MWRRARPQPPPEESPFRTGAYNNRSRANRSFPSFSALPTGVSSDRLGDADAPRGVAPEDEKTMLTVNVMQATWVNLSTLGGENSSRPDPAAMRGGAGRGKRGGVASAPQALLPKVITDPLSPVEAPPKPCLGPV